MTDGGVECVWIGSKLVWWSLQALQEADTGMTEGEWQGAMHWKTWVLAGLDVCISTIKCATDIFE